MASRYEIATEVLQGYLNGISNAPDDYLLDKILPAVPGKASGVIVRDDDAEHFGGDPDNSPERLPGGDVSEGTLDRLSSVPYSCALMDRAYPVAWEDMRRSDLPLPLIQRAQKKSLHYVKTWEERRFASVLLDTAWVYDPGAVAEGDRWDAATGDPRDTIDAAIDAMAADRGLTLILSYKAANALARNTLLAASLNTAADRSRITLDRFLEAYGRDRGIEAAYVMRAKYNTSKSTTRALSRVGGDTAWAWLGVINPGSGVLVDSDLFLNPTAIARVVEESYTPQQWDEPKKKSTMIGTGCSQSIQAVDVNLGSLMLGLTS